jgi:hypothetical protein
VPWYANRADASQQPASFHDHEGFGTDSGSKPFAIMNKTPAIRENTTRLTA